ncbi:MAG: hypothetical protein ACOC3A_02575 [Thermodesulfobacteriota bacterium]
MSETPENQTNQDHEPTELVKIAVLEDPFEAQLVGPALEEESIPHLIRSYHDTAYDGLFQSQKGWGEIRAPENFRARIIDILTDLRSQEIGEGSGDGDPLV